MSTFVSVGNAYEPFPRLLNEVGSLLVDGVLPVPVVVQHGHTAFKSDHCRAVPFVTRPEFSQYLQEASLVIIHAGAGSILEALRAGHRPVVMPRVAEFGEHIDDHQLELARLLASQGRIVLAESADELRAAVIRSCDCGSDLTRGFRSHRPALVDMVSRTLDSWKQQS